MLGATKVNHPAVSLNFDDSSDDNISNLAVVATLNRTHIDELVNALNGTADSRDQLARDWVLKQSFTLKKL